MELLLQSPESQSNLMKTRLLAEDNSTLLIGVKRYIVRIDLESHQQGLSHLQQVRQRLLTLLSQKKLKQTLAL